MEKLSLELEVVTPVFIAGADQKNIENDGLRAPSLRGLLRWWFRAALGGAKFSSGALRIEEVRREENEIWGDTNRQSKVAILASPISLEISSLEKILKKEKWRDKKGVKYLSYGLSKRKCITPGSRFSIDICFRSSISDKEKSKVIGTLWLLLNLGNIGSISRKGFGSLRVYKEITINGIEFKNPESVEDLSEYLRSNIKKILKIFGLDTFVVNKPSLPEFSVIVPSFWKMKILEDIYNFPSEAINEIGKEIRKYRESAISHTRHVKGKLITYRVTKDYDAVKSIYTRTPASIPHGSIFGLPHQFQFQSLGKKAVVKGIKHERRASPLYIKIWKLNERRYAVGLQLFKSKFLPEEKLRISDMKNSNIKTDVNVPSYTYLENFLNRLQGRWISL